MLEVKIVLKSNERREFNGGDGQGRNKYIEVIFTSPLIEAPGYKPSSAFTKETRFVPTGLQPGRLVAGET